MELKFFSIYCIVILLTNRINDKQNVLLIEYRSFKKFEIEIFSLQK